MVIRPGDSLHAIAAEAYGHGRSAGFIARFNGLPDPEVVSVGISLKTPSLSVALREAGLDSRYQPAINALAKSSTDFFALLPSYREARTASGVSTGTFAIPPHMQAVLNSCADLTDAAMANLESVPAPHLPPKLAAGQFRQTAALLRDLAKGSIDGYGYDYDMVGQRFGLGFTNLLIWVQQQDR